MTAHSNKVLDRIRKLLALAESANEHEAASAAAEATRLMLEHQITEASLEELDEAIVRSVLDQAARLPTWKSVLALACARGLGCECFQRRDDQGARKLAVIVGPPGVLQAVAYMYAYLVREIDRLADQAFAARAGTRVGARSWKNSFRRGAAGVIQRRLVAQREDTLARARAASEHRQALVHLDALARRIEDSLTDLKLRGRRMRGPSNVDGYLSGLRAGVDIELEAGPGLHAGARRLPAPSA